MSAVAELPPPPAPVSPASSRPLPPPAAPTTIFTDPDPGSAYRWTVERYERLGELGLLTRESHVELLDGYLVEKEVNHPPHSATVTRLNNFFGASNAFRWCLRCQQPVRLPDQASLPEPDMVLARPSSDNYATQHPGPEDIFLLIEVANTSVAVDRGRKLDLYARAGIAEYWIVNVPERSVEVYRNPQPDAGTYAHAETARPGASLAPAAFPDAALSVSELLGAEFQPDAVPGN